MNTDGTRHVSKQELDKGQMLTKIDWDKTKTTFQINAKKLTESERGFVQNIAQGIFSSFYFGMSPSEREIFDQNRENLSPVPRIIS